MCAELERRGVDVSHVLTRGAPNRFAVIAVDNRSGERLVFWDRDAHLNLAAADIPAEVIASARVVHVDDEDQDASICAAQLARKANVIVTSDIDRMTNRTAELVATVTVPMFNEHTLPEFTGEPDLKRALFKLRRSHPGMLCVTLGPSGAMLLAGEELIYARNVAVRECRRGNQRHARRRDGQRPRCARRGRRAQRSGITASVRTRPIAFGSVMPLRNAIVGAISIGDDGARYSPGLMPAPNRITGTRVS